MSAALKATSVVHQQFAPETYFSGPDLATGTRGYGERIVFNEGRTRSYPNNYGFLARRVRPQDGRMAHPINHRDLPAGRLTSHGAIALVVRCGGPAGAGLDNETGTY